MALVRDKNNNRYGIKGRISTGSFNMRDYLENDNWGNVVANVNLDAVGSDLLELSTSIEGAINLVEYKGYTYENLDINGLLEENLFQGSLSGEEENLGFNFNGVIDLKESQPTYNFELDVKHVNPVELFLAKSDRWKNLSGNIKTVHEGKFNRQP